MVPGALSRLVGVVSLLFALPLIAATALAVLVTMGRPILFVQPRSGIAQRRFHLVKFRTMTQRRDANDALLPDADRTTPIGRFLRHTRLDELPGLVNVARGDLAMIGPRPLLAETIRAMGSAGEQRARVAPGMTGWAQVNGNILLSNDEKLALDLWYINNRNWRLDLDIIWRTLGVVIGGEKVGADQLAMAQSARDSDLDREHRHRAL